MKIQIEGYLHEVIYIEYSNGLPHSVVTQFFVETADIPYWRNTFWDFFPDSGEKDDICAYESGSGGDIQAPRWADGYTGLFWKKEGIPFRGEPNNFKSLNRPKVIRTFRGSSINPFKISEITHSHEYCEQCDESSRDICWKHVYEDESDNYNLKYKNDNSPYS